MSEKTIFVDFAPDGTFKIEAQNFKGVGCRQATAFLEKALGRITSVKKKPEYNQQQGQGAQQTAQQ